ncbi:proton-coupled amino acid transporter-like protein pathetic [Cydia pomonella]|uniref:proton-coupled amino acid transporter-like protein pathetic n=1 Tax=Cydia pomonella TaxID=82600 RepID=UPI002ADD417B|nr:proton-coupled amino acid transporter-like protein pathetic [Cydia pomonella]
MNGKESYRSGEVTPSTSQATSDQRSVKSFDFENEIRQYVEQEAREDTRRDSPPSISLYPGTRPVVYDYTRERQNPHPANLVESTAHLVKGCMGAGMLSMHEAFMRGGIWTSFACTIVIGVLVTYIMLMLVRSVHKMYARIRVSRLSYPDLAEAAVATGPARGLRKFSKAFRYTVDVCLFTEMCGTCCIFELIIARTLKQGLEGAIPEMKNQNFSIRIYILIITIPLIMLCMIRSLKYLAPVALVASLFVTFIACATTIYSITSIAELNKRPAWKDYHGFFRFLGTCIYSVQGVTITLPLENNMRSPHHFATVSQFGKDKITWKSYGFFKFLGIRIYSVKGVSITLPLENNMRSPHHFATVSQFGMSLVVLMVAAIGLLGYWGYGEQCETPITIHLPLFMSTVVLQFILVIMMSAIFALHCWLSFRIIWYYIGKRHRRKREVWERFYRALNVVLISCVSLACPDINLTMSFLGAVICSWVCFIFPALIDSLVTWRDYRSLSFLNPPTDRQITLVPFTYIHITTPNSRRGRQRPQISLVNIPLSLPSLS